MCLITTERENSVAEAQNKPVADEDKCANTCWQNCFLVERDRLYAQEGGTRSSIEERRGEERRGEERRGEERRGEERRGEERRGEEMRGEERRGEERRGEERKVITFPR
ncbi:hypothetical protein Q8A73_014044 [Channa argus]|nr:hypothetical protein Q8A73_014044 [Channa argus]